ncbi:MAG: hypothetical protein ACKVOM_06535 [Ferruginibacter sp.]
MKKILIALLLMFAVFFVNACPVCERAKAKTVFGSITHGAGPTSNWDYVAVAIAIISVLLTLIFTIKYLVKPNEKNNDHIKYSILNFEQ